MKRDEKDGSSKTGAVIIIAVGVFSLLFCLGTAFVLFGVSM